MGRPALSFDLLIGIDKQLASQITILTLDLYKRNRINCDRFHKTCIRLSVLVSNLEDMLRYRTMLRVLRAIVGAACALGTLAACASRSAAPVDIDTLLADQPTQVETPAAAVAEVTPTNVPVVTPTPETDENCLNCHSNQELLQALATPEADPGEALSSGEG